MFRFPLKYHRDSASLLSGIPQFSANAVERLAQREQELGVAFPESVREWYSIECAVDLLRQHSNDDIPVAIDKLGQPFPNWHNGGRRDFVDQGLVVFMHENQGVCNWAFRLDGNPDPEVVVEVDTAPNDQWLRCADMFSTFIFCQLWDHQYKLTHEHNGIGVSAQEFDLAEADLKFLKANFLQRPSTNTWPGNVNYRFEAQEGGILIWEGNDQADWFVTAKTPSDLRALLTKVWHCGHLADTLYGLSPEADEIIKNMRTAGPHRGKRT